MSGCVSVPMSVRMQGSVQHDTIAVLEEGLVALWWLKAVDGHVHILQASDVLRCVPHWGPAALFAVCFLAHSEDRQGALGNGACLLTAAYQIPKASANP